MARTDRDNTLADRLIRGEITFEEYKRQMLVRMAQCIIPFIEWRVREPEKTLENNELTFRKEVEGFLDKSEPFSHRMYYFNEITKTKEGLPRNTYDNYNWDFMYMGILYGLTYEYMNWAHKYGTDESDKEYSNLFPDRNIGLFRNIADNAEIQKEAYKNLTWDQSGKDLALLTHDDTDRMALYVMLFAKAVEKMCNETGIEDRYEIGMLRGNIKKLSCFNEKGLFIGKNGECYEPLCEQVSYADDLLDKIPRNIDELLEDDDELRNYRDYIKAYADSTKEQMHNPNAIKELKEEYEKLTPHYKDILPSRFDLVKDSVRANKEYKRILKLCKQRGID